MAGGTIANYKVSQITEALRSSLDMLGAVCAPDVCTARFPPILNNIFEHVSTALLRDEGEDHFAIGLPRGHAKTLKMKMMLCWAIFFSNRQFIAVVCASEDLAINLIADVWDILQSDNIIQLFGAPVVETDTKKLKKFVMCGRDIIIRAQGVGTAVRGLNIKMRRPDLFLMDDMQTREDAQSEVLAKETQKWFLGTLMKAKAPERCTFIYLGNMYPDVRIRGGVERYTCILRNLQRSPSWTSWIVGAILKDGEALWPEVRSKKSLLKELEQDMEMGEEATFYAEVLNDPNAINNPIWDATKVGAPHSEVMEGEPPLGRFIILDPSLGKKKSDEQIGALFEWWDDIPHLVEIRSFRMSAPETVKALILWMVETRTPLLAAESVAYQATILQWFDFMCQQVGIEGLTAVPVMPRGRQKNARIISAMKAMMAGRISISYTARPATFLQGAQFIPSKTDNADDIWDTISYADDVMMDYYSESIIITDADYSVVGVDTIGELSLDQPYNMIDNSSYGIDFQN